MSDDLPIAFGRYELIESVAAGPISTLYRARSLGLEGFEKPVIVKRFTKALQGESAFVAALRHEVGISVTLNHLHVIKVLDLGLIDGHYYVVTELVPGFDLRALIARGRAIGRPFPPALVAFVGSQIAEGLDHIHRQRDPVTDRFLVHGAVHSNNVMVSDHGDVKIGDFGMGRIRSSTEHSEVVLDVDRFACMSPEQARGDSFDLRADIFALGTVMYEALTGSRPFVGHNAYATMKLVKAGVASPLRKATPRVPHGLAEIVERAMDPGPDRRHADAAALHEDLVNYLYVSKAPVSARELALWVTQTRDEAEDTNIEVDAILRAFADNIPTVNEATPAATRIPTDMRLLPESGHLDGRLIESDVTLMAIRVAMETNTLNAAIADLLGRYGGRPIASPHRRTSGHLTLATFGLREAGGAEAAARCALRIIRAAVAGSDDRAALDLVGIGLQGGSLELDDTGMPIRDSRYAGMISGAMRLAERAGNREVLTGSDTEPRLREQFALKAVELVDGPAFQLIGEQRMRARGAYVGQATVLRKIGEVLAQSNTGGLRVVAVHGGPGAGKTRLVPETMRRLEHIGKSANLCTVRCRPDERQMPMSAARRLVRALLGIRDREHTDSMKEKLARLEQLGFSEIESDAIASLVGVPVDRKLQRSAVRASVTRLLTRLSSNQLTLVSVDGADYMDEASSAFLQGIVRDADVARAVLVLLLEGALPPGFSSLDALHSLALERLSTDEVARLCCDRLDCGELPHRILRDVTTVTDCTPLYVEEYLALLIECGALKATTQGFVLEENEVPAGVDSLEGVIRARLNRLNPVQQKLLRVASLMGAHPFSAEVLVQVTGEDVANVTSSLSELEDCDLIQPEGAGEFVFGHQMAGNIMRESLPFGARRTLYAEVAAAMEALFPEQITELAEQLAVLLLESGDTSAAIDYHVMAGERLARESAPDAAIAHLGRAATLLERTDRSRRQELFSLFDRITALGPHSLDPGSCADRLEVAVLLAEACGDTARAGRYTMVRGQLLMSARRLEEGRGVLARAQVMPQQDRDDVLVCAAALATAEAEVHNGEFKRAGDAIHEAIQLSTRIGDASAKIRALVLSCQVAAASEDTRGALAALDEARSLAGEQPDPLLQCELFRREALVHRHVRNHEHVIDVIGRAVALAREHGLAHEQALSANILGEAHLVSGDYKSAFLWLRHGYELARDHGFTKVKMANVAMLGFIDAMKLDSDEGRQRIAQSCAYAAANGYVLDLMQARYLLAMAEQKRGARSAATKALKEVLTLARDNGHGQFAEAADEALSSLSLGRPIAPWW